MDLWLIILGVFFLGSFIVVLSGRLRQIRPSDHTLIDVSAVYFIYIFLVGLLVAFNLFQLDKMDPFFQTTRWHVFLILYWPSWVLTFAPLLIGGTLAVVTLNICRPRRLLIFGVLLAVTFIALEAVFLLNIDIMGRVLTQAFVFIVFVVYALINRPL